MRIPDSDGEVELHAAVAHHAAEAVEEAEHLHAVALDRRAAEAAQRRVQARAITAAREDADVLGHARKLARSGPHRPAPVGNEVFAHPTAEPARLCGSLYSSTMLPAQIQYRSAAGTSIIVSSTILRL